MNRRRGILAWIAFVGCFLLLAGQVNLAEAAVAALAAGLSLRLLYRLTRHRGTGSGLRAGWFREHRRAPLTALHDAVVLSRMALEALRGDRRAAGSWHVEPLPAPRRRTIARRALLVLAGSLGGNRYVVDVRQGKGEEEGLLVHRLRP